MKPRLRCAPEALRDLEARYAYPKTDDELVEARGVIQARGAMTLDELRRLARWKATRSAGRVEGNSPAYVEEITGLALSARTERARIESLTLLDGVGWPTASVILHFYHEEPYPILDFRALWSLALEMPSQYTFPFWEAYVASCRDLSRRTGMNMRQLDRALWQYSKENQREG